MEDLANYNDCYKILANYDVMTFDKDLDTETNWNIYINHQSHIQKINGKILIEVSEQVFDKYVDYLILHGYEHIDACVCAIDGTCYICCNKTLHNIHDAISDYIRSATFCKCIFEKNLNIRPIFCDNLHKTIKNKNILDNRVIAIRYFYEREKLIELFSMIKQNILRCKKNKLMQKYLC